MKIHKFCQNGPIYMGLVQPNAFYETYGADLNKFPFKRTVKIQFWILLRGLKNIYLYLDHIKTCRIHPV